jgi:UDP-N-acetylglucosamine 4,6-dehydratase/5-epimerase
MINRLFTNKILLITGGTGSFGSTILKELIKTKIKEIRILSRDELKQFDLRAKFPDKRIKYFLGDVRDIDSISYVFKNVNFVFHAAALKQVPSCEFQPEEAFKTNVIGSKNVIDNCINNNISKAIFLSTDKAVNPINVMGMTKSLMEKLVVSYARKIDQKKTKLIITRYGNVMCSRGSVIPYWVNQIKQNKKVTITDKKMTRFLMSLDECHKLVFHAFENGKMGDIFVQKSNSATLIDLFYALQKILKTKSKYEIVGPRKGEKFHEVLISETEMPYAKNLKKYFKIENDTNKINHDDFFYIGDKQIQNKIFEYNSRNEIMKIDKIIRTLLNCDEFKKFL